MEILVGFYMISQFILGITIILIIINFLLAINNSKYEIWDDGLDLMMYISIPGFVIDIVLFIGYISYHCGKYFIK